MLSDQLAYDNNLLFNQADHARTVTYNGIPDVPALIGIGKERQTTGRTEAVADELVILVRKADVDTFAKGTVVVVDDQSLKIHKRIGGGYLNHELLLHANEAPVLRRSL